MGPHPVERLPSRVLEGGYLGVVAVDGEQGPWVLGAIEVPGELRVPLLELLAKSSRGVCVAFLEQKLVARDARNGPNSLRKNVD